jgi:hypothetical protein
MLWIGSFSPFCFSSLAFLTSLCVHSMSSQSLRCISYFCRILLCTKVLWSRVLFFPAFSTCSLAHCSLLPIQLVHCWSCLYSAEVLALTSLHGIYTSRLKFSLPLWERSVLHSSCFSSEFFSFSVMLFYKAIFTAFPLHSLMQTENLFLSGCWVLEETELVVQKTHFLHT